MAEKIPEFIAQDIERLKNHAQVWAESEGLPRCGVFVNLVHIGPRKGSFRDVEMDVAVCARVDEGNIAERLDTCEQILKAIPSSHWNLVMQMIYAAKGERMQWEMETEPLGISPPLDSGKEVEPVNETGLSRKLLGIRDRLFGLKKPEEPQGENHDTEEK